MAEPETPTPEPPRAGEPTPGLAAPAADGPVVGEPTCPTRGAGAPDGALAGRAAGGVPPLNMEAGGEVAVGEPATGRVAAEGAVPVEPDPAGGAAATRGAPKPLSAEGFVAAGELAGAVARLLPPKLGGAEGEPVPAPDPAACIVGTVEPAAG
ncbi:MAG TPA: hypothetical protein VGN57_03450 [Pirellulaceae bacterium]|nr:hypothetical protein [Pirellulaceae bacterium]